MNTKNNKTALHATLAAAAEDTVNRFGSGIKEHLVALKGIDREISVDKLAVGKTVLFNWNGNDIPVVIKNIAGRNNIQVEFAGDQLHTQLDVKINELAGIVNKRSLAQIAQSRVNPEFAEQNLKQQAGFSAEVKEVARQRAEEVVAGKNPQTVRTDDLPGHVNDPFFDITCEVDAKGNPIPGASAQMKFVGSSPEAAVDKMLTKQYQKYHDNDVKIMVPKDYYPGMKEALQNKITSLEDQISTMRARGYSQDAINAKVKQLENCKTLQKNLLESKVTNAEAMEARTNPTLSTAKDIAKLAHRAGVQQAAIGAAVGGGVSIVRNAVALYKGDKRSIEALKDVAVPLITGGSWKKSPTNTIFLPPKGFWASSKDFAHCRSRWSTASSTSPRSMETSSMITVSTCFNNFRFNRPRGLNAVKSITGYGGIWNIR